MKTLWNISWSQYSWWETWQVLIALPFHLLNFNTNILDIGISSRDVKLVKKILETEKNIDINELNIDGMTALHIASSQGNLEIVRFLVEEKNANINIKTPKIEKIGYIKGDKSAIDFGAKNLHLDITIYFLELGLEMPKVRTIFLGSKDSKVFRTGKEFCTQLCDYFQKKTEQNPKNHSLLKQVENIKEDFYKNTLAPLVKNSTKQYFNKQIELVIEEKNSNDITDLIGVDDA